MNCDAYIAKLYRHSLAIAKAIKEARKPLIPIYDVERYVDVFDRDVVELVAKVNNIYRDGYIIAVRTTKDATRLGEELFINAVRMIELEDLRSRARE